MPLLCKAVYRSLSSKPETTPLGQIGVKRIRITEEQYKLLQRQRYKRRNRTVGLLLLAGVLSVYAYSMYAVQQDPLQLDELIQDKISKDIDNNTKQ